MPPLPDGQHVSFCFLCNVVLDYCVQYSPRGGGRAIYKQLMVYKAYVLYGIQINVHVYNTSGRWQS